jgi:hypothetical protein
MPHKVIGAIPPPPCASGSGPTRTLDHGMTGWLLYHCATTTYLEIHEFVTDQNWNQQLKKANKKII